MPISPNTKAFSTVKIKRGLSVWNMNVLDLLSLSGRKISFRELAFFCRKAAFLLDAGLPVKTALPILAEQSRIISPVIWNLHSMVMQGESFSHALKDSRVFPPFMCGYVAIGERTAQLPKVLEKLADYYETQAQTQDELTAAIIYPVMVSAMMIIVLLMAVTSVLPNYSRMFSASGVALPRITSALLSISDFVSANTFEVFGGIFIAIFFVIFLFRSANGRKFSSFSKLKIPIGRQKINFNLTQAMTLLLSSGLSVSEAVPMTGEITDNPIVKNDLEKLSAKIDSGASFWEALSEIPYINPLFIGLARVGEDTGKLPETLEKCNSYFETSYRHAIRRLNKLIEPVITLTLGVALATLLIAIIVPAFQLANVT
ncbi:MAG: type II secretion system F family protein [Clostridiales bacterium]|jgi:type IV pilus assembly protein PilC|nr:type II secretion system F family protein [Clostridiales bacterium]